MILNFAEALAALGPNAAARIANGARPPANYLFNTFLPERAMPDYTVRAANMIVRSTMAGLVAMDSPYPPTGAVDISTFFEQAAKLGAQSRLTEEALRHLQNLVRNFQVSGTLSNDFLQREALNFLNKTVVQSLMDTSEWLRGQALVNGAISWTFNGMALAVDYGIPTTHKLTTRTDSSNDAYFDSASAFWADVVAARQLLKYNLRAAVLNSRTLDDIIGNSANSVSIIGQNSGSIQLRRWKSVNGVNMPDDDVRYTVNFIIYDEEAEVLDTDNPGKTETVKFMPDGKILFVGNPGRAGYRVGSGSTDDPADNLELGYHHIAPTTENGGNPGRWARLYTPEAFPMQLQAEGVSNELPVLLNPSAVVIATTELSS